MRQNVIIALLSICCTLLAVNVYISLRGPELPAAFGQGAAVPTGEVAVAAVQGQGSDAMCYVYDVATKHLACYSTKNMGIELKGVREVTWDLQLPELPANVANRRLTVRDVKGLIQKLQEK